MSKKTLAALIFVFRPAIQTNVRSGLSGALGQRAPSPVVVVRGKGSAGAYCPMARPALIYFVLGLSSKRSLATTGRKTSVRNWDHGPTGLNAASLAEAGDVAEPGSAESFLREPSTCTNITTPV